MSESGIIYRRKLKNKYLITISKTFFLRSMETLDEVAEDVRTYSIPNTVRHISDATFYHNKVLKAIRLNAELNTIVDSLSSRTIQTLVLSTVPENLEEFLRRGRQSKKALLPNGVWLTTSIQNRGYFRQTTMVVPPDVREIAYLPVYTKIGLNKVIILPGSNLEKIGDFVFEGTHIHEFVAPPSLREIGIAAFLNCKYLKSVDLV